MNATETTASREPARHSSDVKTLRHAASEFAHKRSPWIIAAVIALLSIARRVVVDYYRAASARPKPGGPWTRRSPDEGRPSRRDGGRPRNGRFSRRRLGANRKSPVISSW